MGENELLETLPPHLKVSHKLFEGKHVPDVKKNTTVFETAPKNVFTFVDNHANLVHFLSFDLLQIQKKRKDLAAEYAQLAAQESKVKMLLVSLLPLSPPSTSDSDHDMSDSETPT